MLLSVIVPIFNIKQYLGKCIESIINQTYSDLEIILVDDGSTDGSSELCDKYVLKDSRITVVHKENGGLISARKAGTQRAKGEYITFVDGDDWIETDLYEKVMGEIADSICDVFCYGFKQDKGGSFNIVINRAVSGEYRDERLNKEVRSGLICDKDTFQGTIISSVWSKVFRKKILYENLMKMREDYALGEDCICTVSCVLNAECIFVNNDICGYHYRFNEESIVNSYDEFFYEHSLALFNEIDRIINENKQWKLKKQAAKYKINIMMAGIAKIINRRNGFSFFKQYNYFKRLRKTDIIVEMISNYEAEQIPLGGKLKRMYALLKKGRLCRMVLVGMVPYRWYEQLDNK